VWAEISSEHDEACSSYISWLSRICDPSYYHKVRAYISELLAFASKIKVRKPVPAWESSSHSNSANQNLRFPLLRSLCASVGRRLLNSIY
jgi:hypothetical protein